MERRTPFRRSGLGVYIGTLAVDEVRARSRAGVWPRPEDLGRDPRQQSGAAVGDQGARGERVWPQKFTCSPDGTIEAGPLLLLPEEPLELRVFVDKSVVEVFANGRQAVMRRIYPSRTDSVEVRLFSNGGEAFTPSVHAWEMAPSNPY